MPNEIFVPTQKLVDEAYNDCSACADTINADDGEDENDENYLGIVAMAEIAQSLASSFDTLDACMKAGFFPKACLTKKRKARQ